MRRRLIQILQWVFAAAVVIFVAVEVSRQWKLYSGRLRTLDIDWWDVGLASLCVLVSYAILIETWRRVLAVWDTTLAWGTAARIWFASSLGKYIPGNVWAIAALGMMAKQQGASGVAATGSSIIVNVLNLAAGLAVVLLCGAKLVPNIAVFAAGTVLVLAAVAIAPIVLPRIVAWIGKVTGKQVKLPQIPTATIWMSVLGTTAAWLLYGLAFRLYAIALVGDAARPVVLPYIAVYTGAYIVGFITPIAPGGLGVREALLIKGLTLFGLMSGSDAAIVALTSRLWLTVLEVAPGLVALAATHARTRTRHA